MKKITRVLFAVLAVVLLYTPIQAATLPAFVNPPAHEPVVANAVADFKALSKKEKKNRVREVKTYLKKVNAAKRAGQAPEENTVLLAILAILLPPLAVYLHQGEINNKFWISLILTLLFFIPGIIYALVVIFGADK